MANKEINDLAAKTTVAATDELELQETGGGDSKKMTRANLVKGLVDTSGTPVDNDYSKFTDADTVEGRSYAEVKTDLSLSNVEDTAISTWAGSANITTVGTLVAGDVDAAVTDASVTAKGKVELATTAETTTGTDATRAVTPDGLKDGYQGSANVTTLGTIGTGTWQGDVVDHERGGLQFDLSAITTGDIIAGASAGVANLVTASGKSDGDLLTLQADGTVDYETPSAGSGQTLYEAIVAPSGGDYTTLKAAVDDGALSIFIRNGTYAEGGDIVFAADADNILVTGESREGVVLDFDNNAYSIQVPSGSGTESIGVTFENFTIYEGQEGSNGLLNLDYCDKVLIRNVGFKDPGAGASEICIKLTSCDDVLIDGCFYQTTSDGGSFIGGGSCENVKIVNNTLRFPGNVGNFNESTEDFDHSVIANNTQYKGSQFCTNWNSVGCIIANNKVYNPAAHAIHVSGTDSLIIGNSVYDPAQSGIIAGGSYSSVVGNHIDGNNGGLDGINVDASKVKVSGNYVHDMNDDGIATESNREEISIVGNYVENCVNGIAIFHDNNYIANNFCTNNSGYGIEISVASYDYNVVVGNYLIGNSTGALQDASNTNFIGRDNIGVGANQYREWAWMENTDGDAMAAGDVVIFKAAANGDEVAHTTTEGDDLSYGMAVQSIANGAFGRVQTFGHTGLLKVDGTDDIAIGDFISTFTTEGIGQKAAAGDTAIAIALEAYTTDDSAGVIDARIISPRKVGTVV